MFQPNAGLLGHNRPGAAFKRRLKGAEAWGEEGGCSTESDPGVGGGVESVTLGPSVANELGADTPMLGRPFPRASETSLSISTLKHPPWKKVSQREQLVAGGSSAATPWRAGSCMNKGCRLHCLDSPQASHAGGFAWPRGAGDGRQDDSSRGVATGPSHCPRKQPGWARGGVFLSPVGPARSAGKEEESRAWRGAETFSSPFPGLEKVDQTGTIWRPKLSPCSFMWFPW